MENWEAQFNKIINEIDIPEETGDSITLWEIAVAVASMNEASVHLGKVLIRHLSQDPELKLPDEGARAIIAHLIQLSNELSNILIDCQCPACKGCECTEEEICQMCLDEYENGTDDF